MAAIPRAFRIHEAVALTGFSKYMLDYLAREKIFLPQDTRTGRGIARQYSFADIVILRALREVCRDRGRIRHLRQALQIFRDEFGPIAVGQKVRQHLFVQAGELTVRSAAEAGRELRTGQLTLAFVVDLERVVDEVSANLIVDSRTSVVRLHPKKAKEAEEVRQQIWGAIRDKREHRMKIA